MKKSLIVMLTALIVILAVPVYANGENGTSSIVGFKDVKDSYWAKAQITQAVEKGYVSGFPDGTFKPEQKVSRAEFIRMLVDALKLPHVKQGKPWYQPYVAAAMDMGIHKEKDFESGYNKKLSRLEMIRIAERAADLDFTAQDVPDKELILAAVEKGLVHGTGKGDLHLDGGVSRAEAASLILRVLKSNEGKVLEVNEDAVTAAKQ